MSLVSRGFGPEPTVVTRGLGVVGAAGVVYREIMRLTLKISRFIRMILPIKVIEE